MGATEINVEARERALDALAAGATKTAAGQAAGYSRMHIHRLMQDPRFAAEVERRRAELARAHDDADEKLAVEVLRSIAEKGEEESNRVAAAKALLGHSIVKRKPARSAPVKVAPPVIKIVDGSKEAAEWLGRQA